MQYGNRAKRCRAGRLSVSAFVAEFSDEISGEVEMGDRNATPNLLLLVGLPCVLIFLTIIILLVLCCVLVKLWRRLRGTDDKDADRDHGSGIDLLPSVKLARPPPPELAYHMAAPLGDPIEGTRHYYTVPHESRRPGRLMQEQNAGASNRSPSPSKRLGHETKRRINSSESEEISKPEIFISMFHNTDRDENPPLVIRIDKVINLPLREDMSVVNSYVRLFFICKIPGLPHRRTWKTKVVRESSDPVFDEEVRYEEMCVEELINSTLHFEVLDYHPHGKHSILGQVDLHLTRVQFTSKEIFDVLTLQPRPAHVRGFGRDEAIQYLETSEML